MSFGETRTKITQRVADTHFPPRSLLVCVVRHFAGTHPRPPAGDRGVASAVHRLSSLPRRRLLPLPGRWRTSHEHSACPCDPSSGQLSSAGPGHSSCWVPVPVQCPPGEGMETLWAQPPPDCNQRYSFKVACGWLMSNLSQDVTVYFISLLSGAPPLSTSGNVTKS